MKNIPEKIYLQLGGAKEEEPKDFNELHGVSWHKEKIFFDDLEYMFCDQPLPSKIKIKMEAQTIFNQLNNSSEIEAVRQAKTAQIMFLAGAHFARGFKKEKEIKEINIFKPKKTRCGNCGSEDSYFEENSLMYLCSACNRPV